MKTIPAQRKQRSTGRRWTAEGHRGTAPINREIAAPLEIAKILVPIDFSPHSRKALNYAMGLARQFGSEVTLLHVMEQVFYPRDWAYPFTIVDFPARCKVLMKELKALAQRYRAKIRTVVLLGRPWEEIVDVAKEEKTDLIVIGTHGYTGLKHALVGSIAEKVVRQAPCPVLTVRAAPPVPKTPKSQRQSRMLK
jgi:nucleotide-binding universal stress UspA family protein